MSEERHPGITHRPTVRLNDGAPMSDSDAVVVEEPLEIRLSGERFAVTMRTPGADRELTIGFLRSEGLIESVGDVGTIRMCGRPGEAGYGNVIDVIASPGTTFDPDGSRRGTLISSSCGVCGRERIEDLMDRLQSAPPITMAAPLPASVLFQAMSQLQQAQAIFRSTGGLHAAAACDKKGRTLGFFEDIGRHNAVDKVLGHLLLNPPEVPTEILAVSGRASFDIVQKAASARVPIVISVSAASSLAIDLALAAGITLGAFCRDGRVNIYSHPDRVAEAES